MADKPEENLEYYLRDASKTYWHETEARRLLEIAQTALFDVHRYMELSLKRDDWRQVYSMRCDLGQVERNLRYAWEKQHSVILERMRDQENEVE